MPDVLTINGRQVAISAPRGEMLLSVLRDELNLTGAKYGCGHGVCGACYVLLGDRPAPACVIPWDHAIGVDITTIEGLARGTELHPVQAAFLREDAMQCGYCTAGMVISAVALLRRNPKPSEPQIREAMTSHLCRCGVYQRVIRAIQGAMHE